jgi:hypothetical protein
MTNRCFPNGNVCLCPAVLLLALACTGGSDNSAAGGNSALGGGTATGGSTALGGDIAVGGGTALDTNVATPRLIDESWRHNLYASEPHPWVVNADVHGTGANDVYVAGYVSDLHNQTNGASGLGYVDYWDGNRWSSLYENSVWLWGIWAISPFSVFAVGNNHVVRIDQGQSPIEYTVSATLMGIWAASSTDVVAVGQNGAIEQFDGAQWISASSGSSATLRGVWGSGPDQVFAVGDGGIILRRNAGVWSPMDSGTTVDLCRLWGAGADDVYAVGGSELAPGHVIVHYDGTAWSVVDRGDSRKSTLLGLWGSSSSNILSAGAYRDAEDTPHAELHQFNGRSWTELPISVEQFIWSMWCSVPGDCHLVGPGDTLIHMTM